MTHQLPYLLVDFRVVLALTLLALPIIGVVAGVVMGLVRWNLDGGANAAL